MTCQCDFCKYRRGEISKKDYKKILEKDIEEYNRILADPKSIKRDKWCADGNKDYAEMELYFMNKLEGI
jgi:methionine synthase II (cobalamin-independent)